MNRNDGRVTEKTCSAFLKIRGVSIENNPEHDRLSIGSSTRTCIARPEKMAKEIISAIRNGSHSMGHVRYSRTVLIKCTSAISMLITTNPQS